MLLGLPEFEWVSADSVEAACALLAQSGGDTAVIAGGTDLLTRMKHRRVVPRRLINIKRIPHLDQIRADERDGLRIGALSTIQAIEASPAVARRWPSLKQAAAVLGTSQIRNAGTLGGNLANASPSAEFAPPLLTLRASVRCVGPAGERLIPLDAFFTGPGRTVLRKDELVTEVQVPLPPAGTRSAYLKHSLRRMDVAIASAAVLVHLEGDVCTEARIALGAVAPTPLRADAAEAVLAGQRLSSPARVRELVEEAARAAAQACFPIDDFRAYAEHRRRLIAQLVGQGLERLLTLGTVKKKAAA